MNEEVIKRLKELVEDDYECSKKEILEDLESIKEYGVVMCEENGEFEICCLNDMIDWYCGGLKNVDECDLYYKLMKDKLKKVCKEKLDFDLDLDKVLEIDDDNYNEVVECEERLNKEYEKLEEMKKYFKR